MKRRYRSLSCTEARIVPDVEGRPVRIAGLKRSRSAALSTLLLLGQLAVLVHRFRLAAFEVIALPQEGFVLFSG
ncbi:hypothetical protein [Bradyrhizobium sp. CCGUVB23]|uniref:hypothetical protein n=1 Tax=Bradyrhizobium sp. CCGUVB23 TaxID=2949630 RepID=UPI0020B1C06C|nr:hypothetical protein [Bradyrhizobium sp. CCGUVB23]MCP3460715.1 hypothetical protein [Bradyrhizobium sp. CCGUVB23]